jgi:hypothetical protein
MPTGGKSRGDGLFYEPTVLVDVDHGSARDWRRRLGR